MKPSPGRKPDLPGQSGSEPATCPRTLRAGRKFTPASTSEKGRKSSAGPEPLPPPLTLVEPVGPFLPPLRLQEVVVVEGREEWGGWWWWWCGREIDNNVSVGIESRKTRSTAREPSTTNNCWPSRAQKESRKGGHSTSNWTEGEQCP